MNDKKYWWWRRDPSFEWELCRQDSPSDDFVWFFDGSRTSLNCMCGQLIPATVVEPPKARCICPPRGIGRTCPMHGDPAYREPLTTTA